MARIQKRTYSNDWRVCPLFCFARRNFLELLRRQCQSGVIGGQMGLSCLRSSFASPPPAGRRLRSLARVRTYCLSSFLANATFLDHILTEPGNFGACFSLSFPCGSPSYGKMKQTWRKKGGLHGRQRDGMATRQGD
ncbi:hypothetical protein FEI15_07360 [Lacticaseibacillus zeae]|uniref:Uncharacterized protein n=1 Tax=Lacticaseibacillus zeae TaxID=57037 RepID=A0A5R8LQ31_LACZE|nr:hypothetical protein FEI15_07360 [Lacticaseibacillus zeae]